MTAREWPLPGDREAWVRLAELALQREMLAIDERFGREWLTTMRAIVRQRLPHAEFTVTRMDELRDWTRARKLAQSALRYKFNAKRRPLRLIRRDVKRAHT